MDIKTKCLTLSAIDLGENDKLVTVLSDSLGKITIKARGVKKATAKFKFAAQPFCFMECVLIKNREFYTLVSASGMDSFGGVMTDLDKLQAGYIILETVSRLSVENSDGALAEVLKALGEICYTQLPPMLIAAVFMSRYLILSGYLLELGNCVSCGRQVDENSYMALSVAEGGMKCENCLSTLDNRIKLSTYHNLTLVRSYEYGQPNFLSEREIATVIGIYSKMIERRTGSPIKSISAM